LIWVIGTKGRGSRIMIEGSFSDVSLSALLQLLCLESSKSFRIRVTAENQKGYILIRRGAVIAAQFGILEGEDAICEFLSWSQGQFLAEQVVAQTDVEKNLRDEIRPNASFIEDCTILAERQIGLNSEITGSDLFGSPAWKELIAENPLDRECFSVLAWLREGRKMRLATREFGFDLVKAVHILALLVRTDSVQVIRPGSSTQQPRSNGTAEYNVVSTTGGQQEAAALLAKEAAKTLEASDVGEDSFVSKSFKGPPPAPAVVKGEVNSATPSGEFTASRSSMEARLRAKRTGNNLPALTPGGVPVNGGTPVVNAALPQNAPATIEAPEAPRVPRPDLNAVLQNQPRRIIDTSDMAEVKPVTGVNTSSTNDAVSLRQANLKQGKNSGKNGDKKRQVVLSDVNPSAQSRSNAPRVEPAPETAENLVAGSVPPAPAQQQAPHSKSASEAAVVTSAGTGAAAADADRSPSPFAKLAKSIHDQKNKWTGHSSDSPVASVQTADPGSPRIAAAQAVPKVDHQELSFTPQSTHPLPSAPSVTPVPESPSVVEVPQAQPAAVPPQSESVPPPRSAVRPVSDAKTTDDLAAAAAAPVSPASEAKREESSSLPAGPQKVERVRKSESAAHASETAPAAAAAASTAPPSPASPTAAPASSAAPAAPASSAAPASPTASAPAKVPAAPAASGAPSPVPAPSAHDAVAPTTVVPSKPASPSAGRSAASKAANEEEGVRQPEAPAFIPADDRRFVAKTQAMPLVAFDIERLLQTTFFATQFGKLALGNPSLDPHRRQTLLDAEYGKSLVGAIEEGNRLPSAVLSSYRYCLDRGYIETNDPVIPLTADLLLGRMEIDQYLLQRRRITGDELRDLLKTAREEGIKLTQILVRSGYLTEADMETLGREQKRFAFKGK
jgi:hypothetical protein